MRIRLRILNRYSVAILVLRGTAWEWVDTVAPWNVGRECRKLGTNWEVVDASANN